MTAGAPAYRPWQLLIFAIVLLFLLAMAVSFHMAASTGAGVVDRDYYVHGREYGNQALREGNAGRAGWRLSLSRPGSDLLVTVTDGKGQGVSGADVRFIPSTADASRGVTLEERGEGRYLLPGMHLGTGQGRLTVARDDCLLQSRVTVLQP
jgi:nitrogen fixation protein FixH